MLPYGEAEARPRRVTEFFVLAALSAVGTALGGREDIVRIYGFTPGRPVYYTWVTSQFLHGGWAHFLGNFWMLWIFGPTVAFHMGPLFLPFFLTGGILANMMRYVVEPSSSVPAICASGAICAVMGYYAVVYPKARLKVIGAGGRGLLRMSALFYIILYVLLESISALRARDAFDGISHCTHFGGLLFGAFAGLFNPTEKIERERAGPRLEAAADGGPLAQDIDAGDDEVAVQEYVSKLREDPGLRLDDRRQLAIAAKLAELEYEPLARCAAERLLEAEPAPALRADAWLLIGELEISFFKDFAAALEAFQRAADIAEASERTKADAAKGLKRAKAELELVLVDEAQPGEKAMIVQRQTRTFDKAQRQAIERLVGKAEAEHFLAERPCSEAIELARKLVAAGAPVVAIPGRLLVPLPEEVFARSLGAGLEGLRVDSGASIPWRDCLLLSAYAVRKSELAVKREGIFQVDVEDGAVGSPSLSATLVTEVFGAPGGEREAALNPTEYEERAGLEPFLDIILKNPSRRIKWSPDPADYDGGLIKEPFFAAARRLLIEAVGVPINDGLTRALNGRFARHAIFKDRAGADRYMLWQLQLARLDRQARA